MPGEPVRALTLVLPVRAGGIDLLRATLARAQPGAMAALGGARSVRHAALYVLPGPAGSTSLLLESAFQGPLVRHLAELWSAFGEGFSDLSAVSGMSEVATAELFVSFARAQALRAEAFYAAHQPCRAERVSGAMGDALVPLALAPIFEVDERVRRWCSKQSTRTSPLASEPHMGPRSAFAMAFTLRPGRLRRAALRRTLRHVDSMFAGGAAQFRKFGPGGLAALHTSRFVFLPGERLYVSGVVDGPAPVFFDRLSETASSRLSAIFMHTDTFPPTRFVAFGGARRHHGYRRWIARARLEPQIWYSAYPDFDP